MPDWSIIEPDIIYVESYYVDAGYLLDQDWTLAQESPGFWTHDEDQA